jgi:hypothetical protein
MIILSNAIKAKGFCRFIAVVDSVHGQDASSARFLVEPTEGRRESIASREKARQTFVRRPDDYAGIESGAQIIVSRIGGGHKTLPSHSTIARLFPESESADLDSGLQQIQKTTGDIQ